MALKISTKGRYGLIAMVDLAIQYSEDVITIKSISERQNISENYLEQLFRILRKAGLVKSVRGSQGGYILADKPGNITVGMILKALERSLAPVKCVAEDEPLACKRYRDCITRYVWKSIRDGIYSVVNMITLEDLVAEYDKQSSFDNYMYYI